MQKSNLLPSRPFGGLCECPIVDYWPKTMPKNTNAEKVLKVAALAYPLLQIIICLRSR